MPADSQAYQHALLMLRSGDAEGASQWLQIAANSGDVRAMTMLGLYYAESNDHPAATTWLTRAAEAGDQSAMNFLGALYDDRGDLSSAVQWWGRAAQQGNLQAMYNLGELLLRSGYLVEGEGWIRAAAQAGHPKAAARLGQLLARQVVPEPRHDPVPPPPAPNTEPWQPAEPYYGHDSWQGQGGTTWHADPPEQTGPPAASRHAW
ncbi:MAG TPA: tetratricopeptide repeat protein [Mycobacteriales bacterium]|nr:tetratricopeptide repeat protein [Mycobacteriales bacterium]